MSYVNDVDILAIGINPERYIDILDTAETIGLGSIVGYSAAGVFRHAVVANPTDVVVGVAVMRHKGMNQVMYKRIQEGRFRFTLSDPADAVIANRYRIARAVTKSTVSIKLDATGPICGIVDEFRDGVAVVRFDPTFVVGLSLGLANPV